MLLSTFFLPRADFAAVREYYISRYMGFDDWTGKRSENQSSKFLAPVTLLNAHVAIPSVYRFNLSIERRSKKCTLSVLMKGKTCIYLYINKQQHSVSLRILNLVHVYGSFQSLISRSLLKDRNTIISQDWNKPTEITMLPLNFYTCRLNSHSSSKGILEWHVYTFTQVNFIGHIINFQPLPFNFTRITPIESLRRNAWNNMSVSFLKSLVSRRRFAASFKQWKTGLLACYSCVASNGLGNLYRSVCATG